MAASPLSQATQKQSSRGDASPRPEEMSLHRTNTSGASPLAVASTLATCTDNSQASHVRPGTDSTSGSRGPPSIPAAAPAVPAAADGLPPGQPPPAETTTDDTASRTAEALRRKRLIVDATKEQQKAWVERRLDALGGAVLLKRFVMLGPDERRNGGAPRHAVPVLRLFGQDTRSPDRPHACTACMCCAVPSLAHTRCAQPCRSPLPFQSCPMEHWMRGGGVAEVLLRCSRVGVGCGARAGVVLGRAKQHRAGGVQGRRWCSLCAA